MPRDAVSTRNGQRRCLGPLGFWRARQSSVSRLNGKTHLHFLPLPLSLESSFFLEEEEELDSFFLEEEELESFLEEEEPESFLEEEPELVLYPDGPAMVVEEDWPG